MVTSGKGWLLQHLDFSTSCALVAEQSSQQLGDRLPRMLYEVIWHLRARCLSKAPAEIRDWERLGRLHNKFPTYYHSCPSCADAKKISPALTQLITSSTPLHRVDQERWWGGLIKWETKLTASVLAPQKAVQDLTLCFVPRRPRAGGTGMLLPVPPLGTTRGGLAEPSGVILQASFVLRQMKSHRSSVKSPRAPCSGAILWDILCLILTPPAHPSGEESLEHRPADPPPSSSAEPRLCCKNKRVQNLLHKGLEMSGGGGREVSSHNILSRGDCQQTKQALWKRFRFLPCWIGLNLLCSYCLSLDSRIIGYKTMRFCPNALCCTHLQKEALLCPLSLRKTRSNNLVKWVNRLPAHLQKMYGNTESHYFEGFYPLLPLHSKAGECPPATEASAGAPLASRLFGVQPVSRHQTEEPADHWLFLSYSELTENPFLALPLIRQFHFRKWKGSAEEEESTLQILQSSRSCWE